MGEGRGGGDGWRPLTYGWHDDGERYMPSIKAQSVIQRNETFRQIKLENRSYEINIAIFGEWGSKLFTDIDLYCIDEFQEICDQKTDLSLHYIWMDSRNENRIGGSMHYPRPSLSLSVSCPVHEVILFPWKCFDCLIRSWNIQVVPKYFFSFLPSVSPVTTLMQSTALNLCHL